MFGLLSIQFFHSGAHTVILSAPAEKTVGRVRASLAAGELPAHWFLFRLRSIAGRVVDVERPFLPTVPFWMRLIDRSDITVQMFGIHTEHLLHLHFLLGKQKSEGRILPMADDTVPALFSVGSDLF